MVDLTGTQGFATQDGNFFFIAKFADLFDFMVIKKFWTDWWTSIMKISGKKSFKSIEI